MAKYEKIFVFPKTNSKMTVESDAPFAINTFRAVPVNRLVNDFPEFDSIIPQGYASLNIQVRIDLSGYGQSSIIAPGVFHANVSAPDAAFFVQQVALIVAEMARLLPTR